MGRTGQDGETAARAWRRADEQGALGAQVDRRPQPWHLAAVWLDRARREPSHRPVIAHDPLDRTVAARGARGIGQRAFAPALIRWPLWLRKPEIQSRGCGRSAKIGGQWIWI
jgi:hypothetical protein